MDTVTELNMSTFESKIEKLKRTDSPKLLKPIKKKKKKPKTPSPPPKPKTPSPPPKPKTPSPPPKPKTKPKRYFKNIGRDKLEEMFFTQLKKYRTQKYGKEIRPYSWNRNFKIGEK